MRKVYVMVAITLVGVLAAIGCASTESGSDSTESSSASTESSSDSTGALTGQDYGEIMGLYGRYAQGSDFRDAELFVSAFADDAVFTSGESVVEGRDALMAQRVERFQGQEGIDSGTRHYVSSIVINPTADGGAEGRAYWLVLSVSGEQPESRVSGYYEDVFVNTPNGWRIQSRTNHRDRVAQ